ncbi:divalent metal cation transporter [Aestuariibacter sp. GS-14]|uniref:Nramp family divalent metal transporter n=1 Tax=Aestuariibacter sp. GS-14 TaxID=2590670 RepID=UPI00112CF0A6|nr:Nramp family divalent metal transporter [Aestuariibacter sp. GS-14]TPV56893.1 divalent metal cation transporter [Aestuariibacter sp. GS-14]
MTPTRTKSGYIIAAAFIGPGTVTTASLAGAQFGFHLVWALLFSVIATIVLQDMSVRLGFATGKGMSEALHHQFKRPWVKYPLILLVVAAIGIGNAAYESGNLTGAALGLNGIVSLGVGTWGGIMGLIAAMLLWWGKYRIIESVLVALVGLMALVFAVTFAVSEPDWSAMLNQISSPVLNTSSLTTILALIGTTIVPYNLFLHASLIARQQQEQHLPASTYRRQSGLAIGVGGLITLVIMATAMQAFYGQTNELQAGNLAAQLAPLLGSYAEVFFAMGMFAAGLTSAITAPLAAAYAVCGALNKPTDLSSVWFRAVWGIVLVAGVVATLTGTRPLYAILFAQAANGVLLPVIALLLLYMMNTHPQLGALRNRLAANVLGGGVVILIVGLTYQKLFA